MTLERYKHRQISMAETEKFKKWKKQNQKSADLSRKGAVDEPIVGLVGRINELDQYFTTSSCSGRIILFQQNDDVQKKGCTWLLVSHDTTSFDEMKTALGDATENAVLKFEPFVMHVKCRSLDDARLMHSVAVASGFRNSGLTVGKNGKIICAIRSTHSMEVPVSDGDKILISDEHLSFLIRTANGKMQENFDRIKRFQCNFEQAIQKADDTNDAHTDKVKKPNRHHENSLDIKVETNLGVSDEEFEDFESISGMFDTG